MESQFPNPPPPPPEILPNTLSLFDDKFKSTRGSAESRHLKPISWSWFFLLSTLLCLGFLFSVFLYMFIMKYHSNYYSFLNTNKFWFLVSNTLVLVIAADSGLFSSSSPSSKLEEDGNDHDSQITQRIVVIDHYSSTNKLQCNNSTVNRKILINSTDVALQKRQPQSAINLFNDYDQADFKEIKGPVIINYQDNQTPQTHLPKPQRIIVPGNKDTDNQLNQEEDTNKCELSMKKDEADDHFSSMSTEELNRRADEFIRKFYRQQR